MTAAPENDFVASSALGHAVMAGDWPLAVRAARLLESRNALMPDARFVLLADDFRGRDWRKAAQQIEAIERDGLFTFTGPVLRAWLAFGSRQGDPLAALDAAQGEAAAGFANEHRPLLQILLGRPEGAQSLATTAAGGARAVRLRIAAAAVLARRDRQAALAVLSGEAQPLAAARALVDAGRPLQGAIDTPAAGMGELLAKLALDLNTRELAPLATTFARLSTWLAPDNSETWMIAAELAGTLGRHDTAVAMLANVRADDPFILNAREQRIRLLQAGGDNEAALAAAREAAARSGARADDHVRLGEVLSGMNRHGEAADAFARAELAARDGGSSYPEWALWLLRGGAHDQADQWPEARGALERAYSLAPAQPLVLNYLGYAQLSRRENMVEAERLIREAHRLAPDNAAITDSLGWALVLKGEYAEGITLLERAAQAEPADVEINEHLGDAYHAVGRRFEARFAWAAARVYAEGAAVARLDAKIAGGMTADLAAR